MNPHIHCICLSADVFVSCLTWRKRRAGACCVLGLMKCIWTDLKVETQRKNNNMGEFQLSFLLCTFTSPSAASQVANFSHIHCLALFTYTQMVSLETPWRRTCFFGCTVNCLKLKSMIWYSHLLHMRIDQLCQNRFWTLVTSSTLYMFSCRYCLNMCVISIFERLLWLVSRSNGHLFTLPVSEAQQQLVEHGYFTTKPSPNKAIE